VVDDDTHEEVGAILTDKVVVITGGSRGIGRAAALVAARRGFRVVVGYAANKEAADEVVAQIDASNGKAIAVKCDVASEADITALFKAADQFGTLGALVNNAGIVAKTARLEDMSAERITHMMAVNVTGSLLCAREAVRRMSTNRGGQGGVIVNLSSAAARLGSPGIYVDYAATKAAIDNFTLGLAREVADEGIRVNGVRPGIIATDIHATSGMLQRAQAAVESIPLRRLGTADEVAQAVAFLLSDAARYITGATLDVTGGR